MGVEGASFHGFVNDESLGNLFWCFLCIFYYRNSPILKTLGQFENLGFVIMSTRENIRLIARAPLPIVLVVLGITMCLFLLLLWVVLWSVMVTYPGHIHLFILAQRKELKQCFQRKAMSQQSQTELASMLTKIIISSLLCNNDTIYIKKGWNPSIISICTNTNVVKIWKYKVLWWPWT